VAAQEVQGPGVELLDLLVESACAEQHLFHARPDRKMVFLRGTELMRDEK
jgi:hypothetical protein